MKHWWLTLALLSFAVTAQEPAPAVTDPAAGTTIVGEDESPMGLFIMPWRNSGADAGLDKPARLLDEALLPLDRDVFRRQVEYYTTLSEHSAQQSAKP